MSGSGGDESGTGICRTIAGFSLSIQGITYIRKIRATPCTGESPRRFVFQCQACRTRGSASDGRPKIWAHLEQHQYIITPVTLMASASGAPHFGQGGSCGCGCCDGIWGGSEGAPRRYHDCDQLVEPFRTLDDNGDKICDRGGICLTNG